MNAGAKLHAATSCCFHADGSPGSGQIMFSELTSRVAGGAFTLKLDENALVGNNRVGQSAIAQATHALWRQAIFIRARLFNRIGGFAELPIMEDFEFMRRLRKRGRISIVPEPVVTSARRWRESGIWWTTAVNQAVIVGYFLGISPRLLARLYHFKSRSADRREIGRRKSFT
jgi:hypothetical protein